MVHVVVVHRAPGWVFSVVSLSREAQKTPPLLHPRECWECRAEKDCFEMGMGSRGPRAGRLGGLMQEGL